MQERIILNFNGERYTIKPDTWKPMLNPAITVEKAYSKAMARASFEKEFDQYNRMGRYAEISVMRQILQRDSRYKDCILGDIAEVNNAKGGAYIFAGIESTEPDHKNHTVTDMRKAFSGIDCLVVKPTENGEYETVAAYDTKQDHKMIETGNIYFETKLLENASTHYVFITDYAYSKKDSRSEIEWKQWSENAKAEFKCELIRTHPPTALITHLPIRIAIEFSVTDIKALIKEKQYNEIDGKRPGYRIPVTDLKTLQSYHLHVIPVLQSNDFVVVMNNEKIDPELPIAYSIPDYLTANWSNAQIRDYDCLMQTTNGFRYKLFQILEKDIKSKCAEMDIQPIRYKTFIDPVRAINIKIK